MPAIASPRPVRESFPPHSISLSLLGAIASSSPTFLVTTSIYQYRLHFRTKCQSTPSFINMLPATITSHHDHENQWWYYLPHTYLPVQVLQQSPAGHDRQRGSTSVDALPYIDKSAGRYNAKGRRVQNSSSLHTEKTRETKTTTTHKRRAAGQNIVR